MTQEELQQVMTVAQSWLDGNYDAETKAQVKAMMEAEDKTELVDSFYRTLEFGTGGLRGIMGPGTNRMNKYIVAQATQGYANYLLKVQAKALKAGAPEKQAAQGSTGNAVLDAGTVVYRLHVDAPAK